MYAHIYKTGNVDQQWQLILCASQDISEAGQGNDDDEKFFDTKSDAKKYAKEIGAQAWNYWS